MERLHRFVATVAVSDVAPLRQRLEEAMLACGGEPDAVADVILALNEATVNSVRHGYGGEPGVVEVEIWRDGRSLVVKQSDAAPPFDPTAAPTPDTTLPLAARPLGGMGIHMMRSFTDELHYERTEDGRNRLTLIKHDAFV